MSKKLLYFSRKKQYNIYKITPTNVITSVQYKYRNITTIISKCNNNYTEIVVHKFEKIKK